MPTIPMGLAGRDKFGVVIVDGMFRSRIPQAAMLAVQKSRNGIPPGVTQEEWESGRAALCGIGDDIGDCQVRPDGSIALKYAEHEENGELVGSYLELAPGEYTGTPPAISVSGNVLNRMDGRPIQSISAGVMVTR